MTVWIYLDTSKQVGDRPLGNREHYRASCNRYQRFRFLSRTSASQRR